MEKSSARLARPTGRFLTLAFCVLTLACVSPPAAAQQVAIESVAAKPGAEAGPMKVLPEEVTGQELRDLSGRAFRLKDLRGRVHVINLWATWCGPCRLEVPGLNKVYEDFRARGVEFVGLTSEDPEESSEKVREFVGELGMTYRVGWIDKATVVTLTNWDAARPARTGFFALPQTFVVAADGRVVLRVRGYNPRVPDMIRAGVRKALELPPAPAAAAGLP